MKMAETHLDEPVSFEYDYQHSPALSAYAFQVAMDNVWQVIGKMDEYIAEKEPFKLVKTDKETAKEMIVSLVQDLKKVATALIPSMPATAATILEAIKENKKPENLFARLEK
jgi:methionyl-tRNA synthetase